MTSRIKFEQMLEYLNNNNKEKADELFHELVVETSRNIYENLLSDDIDLEDEDMEEAIGGDESDNFLDDVESDDEFGSEDEFGAEDEFGEEGGDEPATKDDILDLKDALEDLKAEFEALLHHEEGEEEGFEGEEEGFEDMEGEEEAPEESDEEEAPEEESDEEDDMEESFVREYVEKIGKDWDKNFMKTEVSGVNSKSIVAGKNDMGGTTKNIARGGTAGGKLEGLSKNKPQNLDVGNVNVPGSKKATKLSGVSKGHGAEKKGASGLSSKGPISGRVR